MSAREVKRHFTATGFVVDGSRTLLHWHKRLQQWMPPGGHIEADEDPVQAVLREIREETGLVTEVISTRDAVPFAYPEQLPPPYTILVEDIPGPGEPHKHIDMIYFCRVVDGAKRLAADPTLRWVERGGTAVCKPAGRGGVRCIGRSARGCAPARSRCD